VHRALARSNGQLTAASRLLGISRPTLYSLLETHGLTPEAVDPAEATGEEMSTTEGMSQP
jgi:DNA-binding NtrC family response regulator